MSLDSKKPLFEDDNNDFNVLWRGHEKINGEVCDYDGPADREMDDNFRMYEFKVRPCPHKRSHDWTDCSYVHPGETARRRDLYLYDYSGDPCPNFRWNGATDCPRGDSCRFAHGVFECWLHPDQYHTRLCEDGLNCERKICFFAHTPEQIRVPGSMTLDIDPHPPLLEVASSQSEQFDYTDSCSDSTTEEPEFRTCVSQQWFPWTSQGIFTMITRPSELEDAVLGCSPSILSSKHSPWSFFSESSPFFSDMVGSRGGDQEIEHVTGSRIDSNVLDN